MPNLELKIPPVVVGLVIAAAMWGIAQAFPVVAPGYAARLAVAVAIAVTGLAIALAGVLEFRRARTTVDPTNPGKSTAIVTGGIYRITRNPMYLGFLLVLVGWAAWLLQPWVWLGPAAFVVYMNRFQIAPEEQILEERFGAPFEAYLKSVRRWI